jgi:hypothetical protein
MRLLEFGVGDVLQVVAVAQGLRFQGAMYNVVDALFDVFPSLSRPVLLLADSSRRMRGGTLVWVALESRSSRCCLAWFVTRS